MTATAIIDIQTDVTALKTSVEALEEDVLVKDVFRIFDFDNLVSGGTVEIPEPCVEGPGVISYYLAVSLDGIFSTQESIQFELFINSVVVARA